MSGNFTVYKSSAGSGKTFTLVKEYLKIALVDRANPPQDFKSILAVTFTNKAAGEMKERVLSTLRELRDPETNEKMMELLCDEMKLERKVISVRAASLLHAILHNYSEFAISTIDSFVHRIVRTFAVDLRLPLNFSIETNKERVLAACVDELSRKVGEDENITKVLVEFSRARMEEDRNWRVDEEILSFAKKLLDEEGMQYARKIKADMQQLLNARDVMNEFIFSFSSQLKDSANEAVAFIIGQQLTESDFFQGAKGIWNYFRKISAGTFDDSVLNSYVRKTDEEAKWKSGKSSLNESHIEFLHACFRRIESFREKGKTKYFTYKALLRNIYSLMVISEIEKIISAYKQQENIVFISEFNSMIAEVIANEPVPFVYERIGEKYRHFLLDEFQDTSRMQWHNLLPLLDNSLASGNFNLVVGDGKQSIYRWRGGDVEQFAGLPEIPGNTSPVVAEREESLVRNYCAKVLDKNFRSRENIVSFNNDFYAHLRQHVLPEEFKAVYNDCSQTGRTDKPGGYVSFNLVPPGEESDAEVCSLVEEYILKNINGSGFSYSDITVLVRNKSAGKKVADHLVSKGIPIVSSESLLLAANEAVGVVVSLLRLVVDERETVHEANVLRYLHARGIFGAEAFSGVWERFLSTGQRLGYWLHASLSIDLRPSVLSPLPLFDLCSAIVRELKLNEYEPLFIQYFLDEVLEYSAKNRENLPAFLDWWEQNGETASAILPGGANAITIMTVHAGKGLQFPVVIFPFADWDIHKSDYLWIDLEEEEIPEMKAALVNSPSLLKETPYASAGDLERNRQTLDNVNLLYVATTRAEDHMHIISRNRSRSGFADNWLRDFFINGNKAEGSFFSLGEMVKNGRASAKHAATVSAAFRLSAWSDKMNLKLGRHAYPEISFREEKREEGILFHRAMSRIYLDADVHGLEGWLFAKGLCSKEKSAGICKKIKSLFSIPQFASFFPSGIPSSNEPDIILTEGSLRPDRVVFLAYETWVIDYKTGGEKPDYAAQVCSYADALDEMGYPSVRKFIVYVEEERIEEIFPAAVAAHH